MWPCRLKRTACRAAVNYRTAVEQAAQYPTHSGAAGTVTPALLPALVSLQVGDPLFQLLLSACASRLGSARLGCLQRKVMACMLPQSHSALRQHACCAPCAPMQAGLAALSGPLDGPSFRDIWRAVTVGGPGQPCPCSVIGWVPHTQQLYPCFLAPQITG